MMKIDFETFAAQRGAGMTGLGNPALHKAHSRISRKQWDRMVSRQTQSDAAWQARRDAARTTYNALVATGEITPPTGRERLEAIAAGHPDNPSVQAARRALAARDKVLQAHRMVADGCWDGGGKPAQCLPPPRNPPCDRKPHGGAQLRSNEMKTGDTVTVLVGIGGRKPPLTGVIVATEFVDTPRIRSHSVRINGGSGSWNCGTSKLPHPFFFESDLSRLAPD